MPIIKEANPKTCKAAPEKKEAIERIKKLAKEYPIIGILNMENLPAGNLLRIRGKLKDKAVMMMSRKTLMELALKELKLENGEELIKELSGMPGLLFTKDNPFAIYKTIKQNKSAAAAKPGQIAPRDITLEKGPTPFGPGPIISEFAMLGVQAGVEDGKVAIKKDATIVKEGEEIKPNVASMLQKLGIEPMEIGLDLKCVYENGTIFGKKVLNIDEEQFMTDLIMSAQHAVNLAVEACIPTKDTVELLIQKASRQGKSLVEESDFLAKGEEADVIAKAERIAAQLSNQIQ